MIFLNFKEATFVYFSTSALFLLNSEVNSLPCSLTSFFAILLESSVFILPIKLLQLCLVKRLCSRIPFYCAWQRPLDTYRYEPLPELKLCHLNRVIAHFLQIFVIQLNQKWRSHRNLQRPCSDNPCLLVLCVFFHFTRHVR